MKLTNNTILITGGASGLGYEFATQLVALGNSVIITGRDQAKLDQAKQRLPGLHTFQSDVSQPEAIVQLYQQVTRQFPMLNVLINNAGEMRKLNLNDPDFDLMNLTREIDINLSGPIRMVQQFLPHLKQQSTAAILNVSSGLAFVAFPLSPIYGATKSGLHSYSQSLRVQLKQTNVRVFELIAPAASTPMNDKFLAVDGFDAGSMMAPEMIVAAALHGMKKDQPEIYPGIAQILKLMSRIAPSFLLKQTSKVGASFINGN
jgi:uncharacterized oxidoreductase